MNLISAVVAILAGILTIINGELGLGLLWIYTGSLTAQIWIMERRR